MLEKLSCFQGIEIDNKKPFYEQNIIIDSISFITLIVDIEEEFGIEIEDDDLLNGLDSIASIASIIEKYI